MISKKGDYLSHIKYTGFKGGFNCGIIIAHNINNLTYFMNCLSGDIGMISQDHYTVHENVTSLDFYLNILGKDKFLLLKKYIKEIRKD